MALSTTPGDVVTFLDASTNTQAGIVVGLTDSSNTNTNLVVYDFMVTPGGQVAHAKEIRVTSVSIVSVDVD
jgi:hypothetical protein